MDNGHWKSMGSAECPIPFLQCMRTGWKMGFGGNEVQYPILCHGTQGRDRHWGLCMGIDCPNLSHGE